MQLNELEKNQYQMSQKSAANMLYVRSMHDKYDKKANTSNSLIDNDSMALSKKEPQKSFSTAIDLNRYKPQTQQNLNEKIEIFKQKLLESLAEVNDQDALVIENRDKSLFLQTRSTRGSRYRGVSKNGSKWQVSVNSSLSLFLFLGDDCQK